MHAKAGGFCTSLIVTCSHAVDRALDERMLLSILAIVQPRQQLAERCNVINSRHLKARCASIMLRCANASGGEVRTIFMLPKSCRPDEVQDWSFGSSAPYCSARVAILPAAARAELSSPIDLARQLREYGRMPEPASSVERGVGDSLLGEGSQCSAWAAAAQLYRSASDDRSIAEVSPALGVRTSNLLSGEMPQRQ